MGTVVIDLNIADPDEDTLHGMQERDVVWLTVRSYGDEGHATAAVELPIAEATELRDWLNVAIDEVKRFTSSEK